MELSSSEKFLAVSSCGFHQSFPKKKVINDTKNSTQHLRDRVASQKCTVFSFARESSSSSFDQADIARDEQIERLTELQDFIRSQPAELTEFDDTLVRRWFKQITIFEDHYTVELKSGLKVDIDAE